MKSVFLILCLSFLSLSVHAGRTVRHQHKCPGIFRGMDVCVNYIFPEQVSIGSTIPFEVQFYTWDSAYSEKGERVFVDMDAIGKISGELMMAHSNGEHMGMPISFRKISVGRYMVEGASFVMPGQWGMTIDLQVPNYSLIKRTALYMYLYPDSN